MQDSTAPRRLNRRNFLQSAAAAALAVGAGAEAQARPVRAKPVSAAAAPQTGAKPLRGLFPIAETPFTPDDKLDLDGLANEVKFCNRGGVPGLVWPQIASGWSTLSEQERLSGAEAMLAAGNGGNTSLVIGVQALGNDLATSIRYAKHAAQHGADAIISLPPDKADDEAMVKYYQAIGAATPLPLIVQTQGEMSIDLVARMAEQIPTMKCVKDEAGKPVERVTEILQRTGGRIAVFAGQGVRTMLDEMQLGFTGYCPLPGLADLFQQTAELWDAGRKREAFDMFGRILAFDSIEGATQYTLVARGVFKENTTHRPTPGMGNARAVKLDAAQKQFIRETLENDLKPYLRA